MRDDFHLVAAYGGRVELRRGGGPRVHVELVPELQENVLEEILERAGVPALRFVANLVFVHHQARDLRQKRLD